MNGGYFPPGGGGGSFDPHSPGPIGDVTPSTVGSTGIAVVNPATAALTVQSTAATGGTANAYCILQSAAGPGGLIHRAFLAVDNLGNHEWIAGQFGTAISGTFSIYTGASDTERLRIDSSGAFIRDSTNGQIFSVYATFTDDSNFSKFSVDCSLGSGAGVFFTIGQTGSGASTMDFYNFDKPMQFGGGVSKTTGGASVVGDGTYTPVTSITILGGLVTAIS